MKKLSTILLLLAFLCLSMSSVFAQSTYVITGSGTQFSATKEGATVSNNQPIQTVIDAIKLDALGDDCTIQFGNGVSFLNTETANITFDGGTTGEDWGLVTLTGKLTSASSGYSNGVVYMTNGVSINSQADITSTSPSDMNMTFRNNSTGTLTISGGTVLLTKDGMTIVNLSTGQVHISGGVVEARGGNAVAITTTPKGKITVSGNAGITSSNINEFTPGTILIMDSEGVSGTCLEITGGTVENTAPNGMTICNNSSCAIEISGGTVSATTGIAINSNSTGKVTISGTALVTSARIGYSQGTIYFKDSGTETDVRLEITGGRIENTATGYAILNDSHGAIEMSDGTVITADGNAIYGNFHAVTISGGTVSSAGASTTISANSSSGVINITGGTVSATTGYALHTHNGTVTISGGTVSATTGITVCGNNGTANISGGIVSATTGKAVFTNEGTITINGGIVSATTGNAIFSNESEVTISGGIVFAYGTTDEDVIFGDYTLSGNAVIVAWDADAETTTYVEGTSDDIFVLPSEATAVWATQGSKNGISVANEENIGFIPIEGVTIEVGISEISSEQIQVYPNPTTGELGIRNYELGIRNVEVFDVFGRKQKAESRKQKAEWTVLMDISELTVGIYFVKITTDAGEVVRKVVKN